MGSKVPFDRFFDYQLLSISIPSRRLTTMDAEPPLSGHLLCFYGGLCRKVLADRLLFSGFIVAALLHALGHATTAVVAGLLGSGLVSAPWLTSSTFKFISSPVTLAFVGLVATAVKGAGATLAATLQSRLAQNMAGAVRRRLAGKLFMGRAALRPALLSARLTVRVREIEAGVADGFLGGLRAALTLAPLAASLYIVNSSLAWGALIVVAPFAIGISFARRAWKRSHTKALALAEGLHQEVDELVVHMDVWRTYGAGERVGRALDVLAEQA